VATFIDHIRCGECETGLTLEAGCVVTQRYRLQPWLVHFWVHCDVCAAHKLYWPTPRQLRLAGQLKFRTVTDLAAPDDVSACYAKSKGWPEITRRRTATFSIPKNELGFLLSMLAATTGPVPTSSPAHWYLPAHWAN